nr:MAG TPA: tail tube protein [Caudoviricetes sp.]
MATPIMRGKDAISGSLGRCYVTIGDNRFLLMTVLSVTAKVERTKKEVAVMGQTGKANKSVGWKGSGTCKLHYMTSIFRELAEKYKNTGEDFYFDMLIENEDPTSTTGKQQTILENCNINNLVVALIDAEAEILDEEFEFTFENWRLGDKFNLLDGMAQ